MISKSDSSRSAESATHQTHEADMPCHPAGIAVAFAGGAETIAKIMAKSREQDAKAAACETYNAFIRGQERMVREAARTGDVSDLEANGIKIEKAEHGLRWKRIEGAE